jgi:hypothetical protein
MIRLEQLKQELEEKRQAFEQERLDWERMNNVTMGKFLKNIFKKVREK